jgi:hypothetical protein
MLGASGVQIGKYIMQAAAGCLGSETDRCNICNIGLCPKGITSQDPRLYRRLDPEKVAQRVVDTYLSFDTELKKIVAPLGRSTSLPIGMSDALGIADGAAAARLKISTFCRKQEEGASPCCTNRRLSCPGSFRASAWIPGTWRQTFRRPSRTGTGASRSMPTASTGSAAASGEAATTRS